MAVGEDALGHLKLNSAERSNGTIAWTGVTTCAENESTPPHTRAHFQMFSLQTFAKLLEVKGDKLPAWPSDDLAVYAEQASTFYELTSSYFLEHSFGAGAWKALGPSFRFLHITSEGQGVSQQQASDAIFIAGWVGIHLVLGGSKQL